MPGSSPLYYWDACLFAAWIADEQRPTGDMDGVREIIQRLKRREAIVITSVLTTTEVLECKMPAGVERQFKDLMKRLGRKSMDIRVAELAHDLRDHYSRKGEKALKTPDAIHLATAIHYRADQFHTFDDKLLALSGNVGGHRLIVCKPESKSPQLDLRKPKPDEK